MAQKNIDDKQRYQPITKDYSFSLNTAYLSNIKSSDSQDKLITSDTNYINLDPVSMDYNLFRTFFYPNESDSFLVNPAKEGCWQITFSQQTVSNEDGTNTFNLLDYVLAAYEKEKNVSRNSLTSQEMIDLTKDLNKYNSLFDISACIKSLKWTEIIDILKKNGLLNNFNDKICFHITFSYYNNNLFTNPVIITFNYIVCDIFIHYVLAKESHSIYKLNNTMFANGTYRITRPGTYILEEDICFNPNRYDNHLPRPDQDKKYPKSQGFVLGFFAAITIETSNVILDLNGYTIKLNDLFNLRQRFCALIELASSPFIPKQGPGNFGKVINSANNTIIRNGTLGKVSHHGIHGNGCKNILIENIQFKDFEVAAIAINGGHNITVNNCQVLNANSNITVLSTYSHARFDLPFLKKINNKSKEELFLRRHYGIISLKQLERDIENEVMLFEKAVEYGWKTINSIFFNKSGLYDGNVYGIVFNSLGVVIGDFKKMRNEDTQGNVNIVIKNVSIENIVSNSTEIISIKNIENSKDGVYGKSALVGPAGDVFDILTNTDDEGYYKGTIIGDLQMALAYHGTDKEDKGTTNIPMDICEKWLNEKVNIMTIVCQDETKIADYSFKYCINREKDSMAHSMKGNIGLFISQGKDVLIDNVYIYNVSNKSIKKENTQSTKAYGILVTGSENIVIKDNVVIKGITSLFGQGESIAYLNMPNK